MKEWNLPKIRLGITKETALGTALVISEYVVQPWSVFTPALKWINMEEPESHEWESWETEQL